MRQKQFQVEQLKIALLIPTRGDRPEFLKNCLRMMGAQQPPPNPRNGGIIPPPWDIHIEIVGDEALSGEKDITWRYRTGYERLCGRGFDLIALIEDDDWYSPDYLQTMVAGWIAAGKPDIFGTCYTIYYHLKLRAWFIMHHPRRASAMNTLLRPDLITLKGEWCADNDPYADLWLWKVLQGKVIAPCLSPPFGHPSPFAEPNREGNAVITFNPGDKLISMGMKHGVGLCGGHNHDNKLDRFIYQDPNSDFLRGQMDEESLRFYSRVLA